MRRKLVVGNWKMNGSRAANAALLAALLAAQAVVALRCGGVRAVPYLAEVALRWRRHRLGRAGLLGARGRRLHRRGVGRDAGRIRLPLRDRRPFGAPRDPRRDDQLVADKAQAALAHRLTPIVCVGETLASAKRADRIVVGRQLSAVIHTLAQCISQIVVAYEPVWAIGTGKTATPEQAQAVHALLRAQLQAATGGRRDAILYGGSVKAENAATCSPSPTSTAA